MSSGISWRHNVVSPETIFHRFEQHVRPLFGANAYLDLDIHTAGKAYEAFVMGLCAEAVRLAGGEAILHGINSDNQRIILRGSPACINSTKQNYGYLACTLGQYAFEIHISAQVQGGSGARHEVDVSVIEATTAQRCRQAQGKQYPDHESVLASCECKCYGTPVKTPLAREFVGTSVDVWLYQKWAVIHAVFCCFGDASLDARLLVDTMRGRHLFENLRPFMGTRESEFVDHFGRRLSAVLGNGQ